MKFVDGLVIKKPENAPEYVKVLMAIRRTELIEWLQKQEGDWINVEVKEAKTGKWYASVNEYKKSQRALAPETPPFDDDIPF